MNEIFIKRLKELRRDYDKSQAKIAVILDVGQTTVAAWEVGRSEPDTKMLIRLAEYFNVSVDYLIGYSNDLYEKGKKETCATLEKSNNYGNIVGGKNNRVNYYGDKSKK